MNPLNRRDVKELQDLPNVGPATTRDLRALGIARPDQLVGRDPYELYDTLCQKTGKRQDPCVLDVLLSVVRFMEGAPAKPWWA
jgi:pathogenicity locus Cdd1 protein